MSCTLVDAVGATGQVAESLVSDSDTAHCLTACHMHRHNRLEEALAVLQASLMGMSHPILTYSMLLT